MTDELVHVAGAPGTTLCGTLGRVSCPPLIPATCVMCLSSLPTVEPTDPTVKRAIEMFDAEVERRRAVTPPGPHGVTLLGRGPEAPPASRIVRPPWDPYFLEIARVVATRGSCGRLQVGAVLVQENRVLACGYNGAPRGQPHCAEAGHQLDAGGHCTQAVHAEANALLYAGRIEGAVAATLYTTANPCWPCARLILNAGVGRVVYLRAYRDEDPDRARVAQAFAKAGIQLVGPGV